MNLEVWVKGCQYHMKHTHTKKELADVYLHFKYALYFTLWIPEILSIKAKSKWSLYHL